MTSHSVSPGIVSLNFLNFEYRPCADFRATSKSNDSFTPTLREKSVVVGAPD